MNISPTSYNKLRKENKVPKGKIGIFIKDKNGADKVMLVSKRKQTHLGKNTEFVDIFNLEKLKDRFPYDKNKKYNYMKSIIKTIKINDDFFSCNINKSVDLVLWIGLQSQTGRLFVMGEDKDGFVFGRQVNDFSLDICRNRHQEFLKPYTKVWSEYKSFLKENSDILREVKEVA